MNVLILGGSKGSWQMRGRQLGAAIGAHVTSKPREEDWSWADVIVLVKRAPEHLWTQARDCGVPIVWDALDFWPQPIGNVFTEGELVQRVQQRRDPMRVAQVIGATKAMAHAIGGVYLTHHCRIGLVPTPPRRRCEVVAYDGLPRFLGSWRPALERACAGLGLRFVVNPPDLSAVDLLVAFRGEQWDGWACREWKSGVKYVNAVAAGRPILTQESAGYREIHPVGRTVEHQATLTDALAVLAGYEVRDEAYEQGRRRAADFQLETIAQKYLKILQPVARRAA